MAEQLKSLVYRQWDDGFVVRGMTEQDAQKVISWYSSICATSVDLQVVLDVCGDDVSGCYVGELDGEVVSSTIELTVGDGLSYGSLVYVDERHRNSGLGRRIMDVARDVTENTSPNIVGIDAHSELEEMYQRRGYKTAFAVTLYAGRVEPLSDASGRSASTIRQVFTDPLKFFVHIPVSLRRNG